MGDIPTEEEVEAKPPLRPLYMSRKYSDTKKPKLWHKRTRLEKILLIILILAFIILMALSITVHVLNARDIKDICLTKDCVSTANYILDSMDPTQDPCNDFFQFTCGNFLHNALLPDKATADEDEPSITMMTMKQDVFYARLRAILEGSNKPTEPKSLWKARLMYGACNSSDKIEELDGIPMKELLENVGGWPVVQGGDWNEDEFDWKTSLYKLNSRSLRTDHFIAIDVAKDVKKSKNAYILTVKTPRLPYFNSDVHVGYPGFNDSTVQGYYKFMVNVSVMFGANRSRAEFEMRKLIDFEGYLAEIISKNSLLDSPIPLTVAEMSKYLSTELNWIEYTQKLLPFKLLPETVINFKNPLVIRKIIQYVNTAPKRVLADYIMWNAVHYNIMHLSSNFRKLVDEFAQTSEADAPRWRDCLGEVWNSIQTPAAIYVRNYFNKGDRSKVSNLVESLRYEFSEILNNMNMISDARREYARDKLNSLKYHIYPDEFLDDKKLDDFYKDLNPSINEHLFNMIKADKFKRDVEFMKLKYPADKPLWATIRYPIHVIYPEVYDPQSIAIPFTLLVGFNFESNRPNYINFATLGAYVGCRIISNFRPDIQDKMLPGKDRCKVLQISNELSTGMHHGNVEVIASLHLTYKIYKKWVNDNEEEQLLPGIEYTQNQIFWIADAMMVCGKFAHESSLLEFFTSRVNGPMSNLPEFANDFNCPVGSAMNPEQKCDVWG